MMILAADYLIRVDGGAATRDAVLVRDGVIRAIGPPTALREKFPCAEFLALPDCVLLPGFVNAHQHGRGISQILLCYDDDALEPWIAGRARYGAPDIYAVTRLAAEGMIANGVTACVHANYDYATGDYAAELDAAIRAYRDSGLRATICVGYQDCGFEVYPAPGEDGPQATRYAGGVRETIELLDVLAERYRDHPELTFALGPAGPQWVSDAAWEALSRHAARRGLGMHFHLLESPAQASACRKLYGRSTLAFLKTLGVFEARTSCAHGVFMTREDLAIAREMDSVVVINPGANMRLFNGAPPVADMLDAGCTLAVGTDNTAASDDEDYLREVRLAQLLGRRPGIDAHGPNAKLMLDAATRNGARAAFLGGQNGTVASGAPADLVALDLCRIGAGLDILPCDLANHLVGRAQGADVRLTMVGGRVLYSATEADRERMMHWRLQASRSVRCRESRDAQAVRDAQARLRRHYRLDRHEPF